MSLRLRICGIASTLALALAGTLAVTAAPALADTNPHQQLSTSSKGVINAQVVMERTGNKKLFSVTRRTDVANEDQWYEVIDSQGVHHDYYFGYYVSVPQNYAIYYWVASWRLCDQVATYCTGYLAIGA